MSVENSKIDELLHAHVSREASVHNILLLEKHGYFTNMSQILNPFYFNILKFGDDILKKGKMVFFFNDMSMLKGASAFFDSFNVIVEVFFDKKFEKTKTDGYYDEESPIDSVHFEPHIKIVVSGNSIGGILNAVRRSLGHEFTHAYTDLMMFRNSRGARRLKDAYDPKELNFWLETDIDEGGLYRQFMEIFYILNRYEQNACIGELRQSIEDYPCKMETSVDLTRAIMSTESYRNLTNVIGLVEKIKNTDWDESMKLFIVDAVNNFSKKGFEEFDGAMYYLDVCVRKAKRKFDSMSSKIAYDVVCGKEFGGRIIDRRITDPDDFFKNLKDS